jgi:glucose-6-phosphate isomerase
MNDRRVDYSLGKYQSAVSGAWEKMCKDNLAERIRAKDYTLWKPAPDEIVNRLGWLEAPVETLEKVNLILAIFEPLKSKNFNDIVLLGIGGSSLAPEVFNKIIGNKPGYPKLHILDTTDPISISTVAQNLDPGNTLFLVSSKSGTTLEINSLLKYFYNLCFKNSGKSAGSHFIFITDEGSPLVKTAENLLAHYTFFSKSDIGGRYSALSITGIVPAAFAGIDVRKLLERTCSHKEELIATGASLGAALGTLARAGRDKLTFILPPHWKAFGDWLEQLIAESTGKEGKGILPVLDEPLTDNTAYGNDRVFVIFQNKEHIKLPPIYALINAGNPVITIEINDDSELGEQMFIWEMATAVAAHFLGVNPFDQPDVEATKKFTRAVIADCNKKSTTNEKPALIFEQGEIFGNISGATTAEAFTNFLRQGTAGDYICLQIYLSPSPEIDEDVSRLRKVISQKYILPVTYGYGPRYLHSTGQLHKGDSGNGLFIQLTQDNSLDVDIPDNIGDEKSSLTFGALKAAQAQGDWQALTDAGRRIIRFHFRKNPAAGLKTLVEII